MPANAPARPRREPPHRRLPLEQQRERNRICTNCQPIRVVPDHQYDDEHDMCRLCVHGTAEARAHRRALLTIRIPQRDPQVSATQKFCAICITQYPIANFLVSGQENPHERCRRCRTRERCTRRDCSRPIKKRKHFEKHQGQPDRGLYRTCDSCRSAQTRRAHQRRSAAEAAGQRYCTVGQHIVSIEDCTDDAAVVFSSCNACRARRRAHYAANNARVDVEDGEGARGDDEAEGVAGNQAVDEYDEFFGDGWEMMDVDLPEDSAISGREAAAIAKMNAELAGLFIGKCSGCREEGFDKLKTATLCKRCDADGGEVRKWSDENNTNPSACFLESLPSINKNQGPMPPALQNLTDLEEMLIARVKTVMQVRYTKGQQLCYKDHIVNLPQDITEIASKLPRLPEDVDIVIIRRDGVDLSQHVDYVVRREKVRKALEYKIAHDEAYRDLQLDEEALRGLPENGSVVHRIPTCREGRQSEGTAPAGPNQAADTENDEEGGAFVGGVPNLGNGMRPEVEEIRHAAGPIAGATYQQTIVSIKVYLLIKP
ncbi:hypothetical protein GGX14DRAFT_387730 [Mycena pura]|uniref:DUF6570 domain-containing protein n=1 Tax=Mycena pura TaxID=153505 RepID=A0AAD6YMF7_9AGAR|nr:hypothetical protein GGX14DRAFT_387730 [Mycena pura]